MSVRSAAVRAAFERVGEVARDLTRRGIRGAYVSDIQSVYRRMDNPAARAAWVGALNVIVREGTARQTFVLRNGMGVQRTELNAQGLAMLRELLKEMPSIIEVRGKDDRTLEAALEAYRTLQASGRFATVEGVEEEHRLFLEQVLLNTPRTMAFEGRKEYLGLLFPRGARLECIQEGAEPGVCVR